MANQYTAAKLAAVRVRNHKKQRTRAMRPGGSVTIRDLELPTRQRPRIRTRWEISHGMDGKTEFVRVTVPAEILAGHPAMLGAFLIWHDVVRRPGSRCHHSYDCCGCIVAGWPLIHSRAGRTLVIRQSVERNH